MRKYLFAMVALLGLMGPMRPAFAVSISLTTGTTNPTPTLNIFGGESADYSLTGTFTGTALFQQSFDGTNWTTLVSSVNNSGNTLTGNVASDRNCQFRWVGSTITAGSFVFSIADHDDWVAQFNNNKKQPTLIIWDESIHKVYGKTHLGFDDVPLSTATFSGNSNGDYVSAWLGGTVDALEGSILVATTSVVNQGYTVCVATANNMTSIAGIAKEAKTHGNRVGVYHNGYVLVLTTGTVNPGDMIVSTVTTAGYGASSTSPVTGGVVGVAISSGVAAGGLTRVRLK